VSRSHEGEQDEIGAARTGGPVLRLTVKVIQQLLAQNEGFETETYFEGNNSRESRQYKISGGQLQFRSTGKTSWAASRWDETHVADINQARRFIRKFLASLNTDWLE
jgi:hypothetical protein